MIGQLGAQVGLLSFAATVFAGLYAGNTATTILLRSIVALLVALLMAQTVAWMVRLVLRDHFQRSKGRIDRAHVRATDSADPAA